MRTIHPPKNPQAAIAELSRDNYEWAAQKPQVMTLGETVNNLTAGNIYMVTFWGDKPAGFIQVVYVETLPDGWYLMTTTHEEPSNYDLKMSPDCVVAFFSQA